jgi:nucleotidyltransferase/DNA polymerase involved in DNA repair
MTLILGKIQMDGLIFSRISNYSEFSPMSLDEAYLDLTNYAQCHPDQSMETIVQELRDRIFEYEPLHLNDTKC